MQSLILVLHVLVAMAIIILVLLQHGRGADVGASFGSGASSTMFGSAGSLPFLMKLTAVLAAIFFSTSILLSYLAAHDQKKPSALDMPVLPAQTAPAVNKTTQTAPASDDAMNFAPSSNMKEPGAPATGKK
jgi:preprotein translocase subunit SecG